MPFLIRVGATYAALQRSTDIMPLYALMLLTAANSTPWIIGKFSGHRGAWPMDGGRLAWDGERWLGSHKTWRGFLSGVFVTAMITELCTGDVWTGAGFAAVSLVGDALSSCIKRRLHRPPGSEVPFVDQLPECLLPLAIFAHVLDLSIYDIAAVTVAFLALGVILTRVRTIMFSVWRRDTRS